MSGFTKRQNLDISCHKSIYLSWANDLVGFAGREHNWQPDTNQVAARPHTCNLQNALLHGTSAPAEPWQNEICRHWIDTVFGL